MVDVLKQVEKFKEFIKSSCEKELHETIKKGGRSLVIDFLDLLSFDVDLAEEVLSEPIETIRAAESALEQLDIQQSLRVRFFNIPESQNVMIKDIRSSNLGTFVAIEGIVRQASDVRPQVTSAKFECPACGNNITILQLDTRFKEPMRCSCGRRGKFRLLSKALVDAQRLVIEEAPESLEGGEQPKRLSVFLKEDLVEPKMEKKTTPGSKVIVTGTITEIPILLKSGAQSTRYDIALDANYIMPAEETFEEIDISSKDEEEIKNLAKDPGIYEKLIVSISPSIYGHDDVKEALLLQLVGGTKKTRKDGTVSRGDIHILLVGDPGSGKSMMLSYISKIAPKGRLVSGKGATAAGITASVVRDEFLRGWALEAGAMVLANGGIAIIDELDKMSGEDRSALHEAMEQQRITISKANIQATLRSETTVLAAANPKLGRFDPYTPIATQIDLPPTLINRFDLIFPIRDIPNKELDDKIAGHILALHQKPMVLKTEIPSDILKKYIAYAKQRVSPKLTHQAIEEIKSFYVGLRSLGGSSGEEIKPIPISARQLEALIRLAEGSAKISLSNKVRRKDAKRAINILKKCLVQVGFDYETGRIDIDRISTGITAAQRSKIVIIREIINALEAKGAKAISISDIISEAEARGIEGSKVEEIIEKLKRSGDLYEPKLGFLSKL